MSNSELVNAHLEGDSFYWEGGTVGVLLLHGLTATVAEVRPLAQLLHAQGYTVAGPLLPGHGTTPEDLNKVSWRDWIETAESNYHHLATVCDHVFVGGESNGAVIALYVASKYPEIAGVLAYAPAIKLAISTANMLRLYASAPFVESIPKEGARHPLWQGYAVNALWGIIELIRMSGETQQRLDQIEQPMLVVQGRNDTTIAPDSGNIILEGIASEMKELHWMEESGHCGDFGRGAGGDCRIDRALYREGDCVEDGNGRYPSQRTRPQTTPARCRCQRLRCPRKPV